MTYIRRLLVLCSTLLLLSLTVTSPIYAQDAGCDAPSINVVATVGMIADALQNVGGNCVQVTQLMGPGVDPHLYRATEGDVFVLIEADMIFYGGLNLEARLADVLQQLQAEKPAVAVGDAIPTTQLLIETNYNQVDPHVWMNVKHWMYVVEKVRDELVAYDVAHEGYYRANAAAYLEQLEELDLYVQTQIYTIARDQRVLVTAHDAFQYFGDAYGIHVFAPQGITTAAEAGVEDIRRTIELIVQRQIPAVFVESSVSPDVVEAIVEGAQAQGQNVSIGGQLFSDSMGDAGTFEGTYIGMITHNVDTIVSALASE
jgi:manganese/zinc/iron transport system substrate-binding protein